MGKTELLISPVTGEYTWKETVHEDFVSREEFINRTGIFVTPSYFEVIYGVEFKESDMSVDEFIHTFEEEHGGEITEIPLQGIFKYMVMDDEVSCIGEYEDDLHEPNIWEIINCLARSHAYECKTKWELVEKYKKVLEDVIKTQNKYIQLFREIQLENAEPTTEVFS